MGCSLQIAGDGRLRPAVEEAAGRLSGVVYHGIVSGGTKQEFLGRCDVGIMPSVWAEPGGPANVMVEWLAAGRPVLVSNRGGLGEAIPLFPGAVAIEPTVSGVVAAVAALGEPAAWGRAVAHVRQPIGGENDVVRWISDHERIFLSALDRRPSSRTRAASAPAEMLQPSVGNEP